MATIRIKLGNLWKRKARTDIVATDPGGSGGLGAGPLGTMPLGGQ